MESCKGVTLRCMQNGVRRTSRIGDGVSSVVSGRRSQSIDQERIFSCSYDLGVSSSILDKTNRRFVPQQPRQPLYRPFLPHQPRLPNHTSTTPQPPPHKKPHANSSLPHKSRKPMAPPPPNLDPKERMPRHLPRRRVRLHHNPDLPLRANRLPDLLPRQGPQREEAAEVLGREGGGGPCEVLWKGGA